MPSTLHVVYRGILYLLNVYFQSIVTVQCSCISIAVIGEGFVTHTSSQLTHHGLCELNRVIKEGDVCVFFRNNHFNTVLKNKVMGTNKLNSFSVYVVCVINDHCA